MTETTKGNTTPSLDKPRVWVEGPQALGRPRVLVPEHDADAVRAAWSDLGRAAEAGEPPRSIIDALQGKVSQPTLEAIGLVMAPGAHGILAEHAQSGEATVVLTFAGQSQTYLEDLDALYAYPAPRRLIEACAHALQAELASGAALHGLHPYGLDLIRWLEDAETRPPATALASSQISQPLIFIAQAARLVHLERFGFAPENIDAWCACTTGHSQGIMPAMLAAEGLAPTQLIERACVMTRYLLWQGIHMQIAWGRTSGEYAPMVAVTGQTREEVLAFADDLEVTLSLTNAPRRFVFSGIPSDLAQLVQRIKARSDAEHEAFADGKRARPRPLGIEWLGVSAPFHSRSMAPAVAPLQEIAETFAVWPDPHALKVPVLRGENGSKWRGECPVMSQSLHPVDWPAALNGTRRYEPTHIIDLGPGAGVSALSAISLRGFGIKIIAGATEGGETLLASRSVSDIKTPRPYTEFLPKAVRRTDGKVVLENRFTAVTGRSPAILPGMTPTTVDARIISAGANAGYFSELAGGGQTSEAIFRERAAELMEQLEPGEGYVFNALYLDPYLWGLHIGKDQLVQRLRAEGHPILGVTISAGIPPVEEAVALLTRFEQLGMHHNSLKVGNDDQIRQALAIADAYEGAFILQIEGGKAGGHHSFDPLDELLLQWYDRIRRRPKLLLAVGGGIGSPERARALMTGTWSERYGRAPMPVDAFFVGTALMAAKETTTSKAVKKALAKTKGTDAILGRGISDGGIRSGQSGLGADIYYIDNHAAQTANLLDQLVGDEAAILARKDELVARLAKTAKPYFGDVEAMTYAELLDRLVTLMALGQNGRYEDGIWLDITHRLRFERMLHRALRRAAYDRPLPPRSALDDPRALLAELAETCPTLGTTPVLPEDARFFLSDVCSRPGKPVPFVPVIDANVRKWFCSDSLWQAHDDRYDDDAVLIIPGPAAVGGIRKADEPVADILEHFVSETIKAVGPAHKAPALDRIAVAKTAPVCLFGRREAPNPIPAILAAGGDAVKLRSTKTGVRLQITHGLPVRSEKRLTLDFEVVADKALPLRASADFAERLRSFYTAVMPKEVVFDAERLAAYRRTTADDGPSLPEQLFFAAALPEMMAYVLHPDLGIDPLSLLHVKSVIEQTGALSAETLSVVVEPPMVVDQIGGRHMTVRGEVRDGETVLAKLDQSFFIRRYEGEAPAAWRAEEVVDTPAPEYVALKRTRPLFSIERQAPTDLTAFAHISGDLNPIHRDPALAALAGLDNPIVHGQWTAATACAMICSTGKTLRRSEARFLAPVDPGADLVFTAEAVGRLDGDEIIEVVVREGQRTVLRLTAQVACPVTAVIFPGQGCQRRGMGMEDYQRSAAARAIWDQADAHTRAKHGFSLLSVVRENPKSIDVGEEVVRHPQGVLNVTQFTQVALTVLSCAGVAAMREAGALPPRAWFCGHSVGEYSALSALTHVLPLNALIDVVYQRGLTMQRFVERDEQGRSDYAMGVIRPHKAKLRGEDAKALVAKVAQETRLPLYVVNHNVRDRQYAVAGHVDACDAIRRLLLERAADGSAWIQIPGIDVPFHSPLLSDGVAAFRDVLTQCIPQDIDIERLEGRYIPNLVAMPFARTPEFVDAMEKATGYAAMADLKRDIATRGRDILIELLAWQFASPVRWITTQDILGSVVDQVIEIGPGAAPVVSNMLRSSLRAANRVPKIMHAERDYDVVVGNGPEEEEVVETPAVETPSAAPAETPTAAAPVAAPVTSAEAEDFSDAPWGIDAALRALLALRVNQPLSALKDSETIDGLLGGNSARRNQILLDLGKEFGVGAVDGAHELPLPALAEALQNAVGARYRHPGPILKAAQGQALGTFSLTRKAAEAKLSAKFGLETGRIDAVLSTLAVEAKAFEGQADPLVAAAKAYAGREGIRLERTHAAGATAAAVDPAALAAAQGELKSHWIRLARAALEAAGLDPNLVERAATPEPVRAPVAQAEAKGRFDAKKHVAFTAAEQWGKTDALRWFWSLMSGREDAVRRAQVIRSASPAVLSMLAHLATWSKAHKNVAKAVKKALKEAKTALASDLPWTGETALITGAGPNSIAEAVTQRLLEGGARVVVTTSRLSRPRLERYKALYRDHAGRGAELHVVPFDQGSFDDIDGLCAWLCGSVFETQGPKRVQKKGPWLPTLCFPFGAMPAEGDPTTYDDRIVHSLTVNLIGVERLVGILAKELGQRGALAKPVHVVLPLSPNHGQMGRDGLYAEAKIGLEAMMRRWASERDQWGQQTTLCGARIGWVRGTGLMHGLDRVYQKVESELGIRTFSPVEMADELLARCTNAARAEASVAPILADVTGGFDAAKGLRELINRALSEAQAQQAVDTDERAVPLPRMTFDFPALPESKGKKKSLNPADVIAVVGMGEIGPFGNERIRWAAEVNETLTPEAALELAWLCGCIRFEGAEWVDAESGEAVDPAELVERYDLGARIGIRNLDTFDPERVELHAEIILDQDLVFAVADAEQAELFRRQDPENVEVIADGDDGYKVVRRAGSKVRVPRLAPLTRDVAGQLPEGFDATRYGFDANQLDQMDPVAIYNLIATNEAFRAAGITPEELWTAVHPARLACSQGSGIGGMRALKRLYTVPVLSEDRQTDVLQETLINVTAAWPGMSFHGGYGAMIHPVAACATAAVSVEVGADLLRLGKADFVVAGAFDDIGVEGARGFADMGATISAEDRATRGFDPNQSSRPCDARRGGFVEAQGGGAILLCRGDLAVELGLPIYGLIAGAWSCSDGIQRSVPAPGPGVMAIAAGGEQSPLGQALARLGLDADDIGAVSIHGTSTEANDLNETALHNTMAHALGRTAGNPLPIIAQKALTGHAKGGAAAWQLNGLMQAMRDGIIPPMRNLEEPDRRLDDREFLVYPDAPIEVGAGQLRAGLVTSLGFGHVGAAVCVAHPDVLLETLSKKALSAYASRRDARWRQRLTTQNEVLLGERLLMEQRTERPLTEAGEKALLLDPNGRIDS